MDINIINRYVLRPILLSLCMSVLMGCAGVMVLKQQTYYHADFDIYNKPGQLSIGKLRNKDAVSKDKMLKYWGKPRKVTQDSQGCEVWHYRQGFGFAGALPVIGGFLPIPLGIPDNRYTRVYFQDDKAVLAEYENGQAKFYGCSIFIMNERRCFDHPIKHVPVPIKKPICNNKAELNSSH